MGKHKIDKAGFIQNKFNMQKLKFENLLLPLSDPQRIFIGINAENQDSLKALEINIITYNIPGKFKDNNWKIY